MPDTYTSPYGTTQQATGTQGLFDALRSITGNANLTPAESTMIQTQANYPSYIQNVKQANIQGQGIPGMVSNYGDQAKILELFAHDQGLSQKYSAPMPTGPTTPGFGAVAPGSLPALTPGTNVAPASGQLTDPTAITRAMGMGVQQPIDVLNLLSKVITNAATNVQTQTSASADAYNSVLGALSTIANLTEARKTREEDRQLQERQLKLQEFSAGMTGDGLGSDANSYVDSFMTGQISYQDIPSNVRTAVDKRLKAMGTSAVKVQQTNASTLNGINILQGMLDKWSQMSPVERLIPQSVATAIPGLSPTRAGMISEFYTTLEPELRKSAVGGRITQQEINWIRNAVLPSPLDTPESAKTKVQGVINGMLMKMKDPSINLNSLNPEQLANVTGTGSTATGSQRNDSLGIR